MTISNVLIFGGSSPIALGIADGLKTTDKEPIIASRNIERFRDKVKSGDKYKVVEIDLHLADIAVNKVRELFVTDEISAIIFAHRYLDFPEVLQNRFQVELITPLLIVDEFVRLEKNYSRSVVFLTSPLARTVQSKQPVGYHMSKSAMTTLSKYYAVKYGGSNIRFNCVSPGAYFEKERSKNFYEENPLLKNDINSQIPMNRFGEISDVSGAVNYLLSETSSYVNGVVLEVDGGLTNVDQSSLI